MLFKLHTAETLSIEIIVDLWYYVIAEKETNQSMINKEITKMKKFTRIITAVMAAATIAVTTTSVCASARTLVTGEVLTEEVVDRYAAALKVVSATSDELILFSNEYGFFNTDKQGIMGCNTDYDGAWIDYWAGLQKSKLCQEREGYTSILDPFSRG
jgi:hypothetical protein